MKRKKIQSLVWLALVALLSLSACNLLREQIATPQPKVVRASADELAKAMQEDHFFSDYGRNSLLIHGLVAAVSNQAGSTFVELQTNLDTKVICDFGGQAPAVKPGDAITIQSPNANAAERAPNAVVLKNCSIPSP